MGLGLSKYYKKAESSIKKKFKTGTEGSIITGGLPGGHAAKGERSLGNILFGESGRSKVTEAQKYTLGSGTKKQLSKDVESTKDYFNPKVPELSPDPQIAAEAKKEAARRRSRSLGRSMLMTSRNGKQKLGL